MDSNIFTEEDYMKFFYDIGKGDIFKRWYVDYLAEAVKIAPEKNGDHPAHWKRTYLSYENFIREWKTEPVHFYINFEPAIKFNEYVDSETLLVDIIERMAGLIEKDYSNLYAMAIEYKLFLCLKKNRI